MESANEERELPATGKTEAERRFRWPVPTDLVGIGKILKLLCIRLLLSVREVLIGVHNYVV